MLLIKVTYVTSNDRNNIEFGVRILKKKQSMPRLSLSLILFLCMSKGVFAQDVELFKKEYDTLKIYRVELKDGLEMIGHYLYHDSVHFVLGSKQIPKVEIPFANILNIEEMPASAFRGGVYWFKNPHATRYFFAPSAINLEKGEGYYQNAYLIFNSFNVGVTDNFSIGGGLEILSLFGSMVSNNDFAPIFFVTPKLSFKASDKFHYGMGVFYVNAPRIFSDDEREGAGITYAMGTYGDSNRNITLGAGLAFVGAEFSSEPIITACALSRISRRTAFVTENWLLANNGTINAVYSYGFRFFGEKIAVDLGFINNAQIASALLLGVPYVDFTIKF